MPSKEGKIEELPIISRISRDEMFMSMADLVAKRGTCGRAQVGAVITIHNRIVTMGYNGPLPGQPHCSNDVCDTSKTCVRAVHAEMNAIAHAAKIGISVKGGTLYCTYAPCSTCARMLIQAGVVKVVYRYPYKIRDGINELISSNIVCVQHTG